MKNKIHYYYEGFADQVLLKVFQIYNSTFNPNGKPKVINTIKRLGDKHYHEIYVGLIDRDEDENYDEFKQIFEESNIRLFRRNKNQFLIELCCPALERWILDAADSVSVKLEDFKFQNDIKLFTKELKSNPITTDKNFRSLLKEIKNKNPKSFEVFQKYLDFIKLESEKIRF